MEKLKDGEFSKNSIRILKGSAISIFLTMILLIIYALILSYTSVQEVTIKPVIIVITGISILIGSSISTLKIKKNGILNGGLVGLIYILAIYIASSISGTGFDFNTYSIIMVIVSIMMGIVGGILGVNIK